GGGWAFHGDGFDHVRVQRSLHQVSNFAVSFASLEFLRFFGKDGDEFPADELALLFRIADALELTEETVGSVDANDMQIQAVAQHFQGGCKFILSQQTGIHKNVSEPVAHGAVHQDRGDGRIHAAAERADGPFVSNLCANGCDGLLNGRSGAPFWRWFACAEEKISQQFRCALGVLYFGMKLRGVNLSLVIFERPDSLFRMSRCAESGE